MFVASPVVYWSGSKKQASSRHDNCDRHILSRTLRHSWHRQQEKEQMCRLNPFQDCKLATTEAQTFEWCKKVPQSRQRDRLPELPTWDWQSENEWERQSEIELVSLEKRSVESEKESAQSEKRSVELGHGSEKTWEILLVNE